MNGEVNVVVDLRRLGTVPATPDEFLQLWAQVERGLYGHSLTGTPVQPVRVDGGWCDVWVTDPPSAPRLVDPAVRFAVRGVIEPPQVRYRCTTCERRGETRYAPFSCAGCGTDAAPGRVCDEHAVILDGSFRATCPAHAPTCECTAPASFWCRGPRCHGRTAHCDRHRMRHPGDPDTAYCHRCHAERYPACAARGCASTGGIACEYTDPRGLAVCEVRACARHAHRWQVFGPQRRGIGLCPEHAGTLRRLGRDELVFQIVAGTAARAAAWATTRAGRRGEPGPRLPRLTVVRHIFINTRGEALDMTVLDGLFASLHRRLGGGGLQGEMRRLLEQHAGVRAKDVGAFEDEHAVGRRHFARLVAVLRERGRHDLAAHVTFADFRSRANLLFVRVPPELEGRFKGRQRSEVDALSAALGVTVQVERR